MGYRTFHSLGIDPHTDETYNAHLEGICDAIGYKDLFEDEVKWYEHDEDMLKYSKLHPDVEFILDGAGEENGDIWRSWYKAGKAQHWALEYARPYKPPKSWDEIE